MAHQVGITDVLSVLLKEAETGAPTSLHMGEQLSGTAEVTERAAGCEQPEPCSDAARAAGWVLQFCLLYLGRD